ncbi:MAG: serpin family protein [Candidatus Aminicenantes bacterium]|nr:serpin family protein [Candidatus Aminicenantes bacterium]MDH5714484.1 serpin family protein [Candidatus Aminicenantes bacterium]
MKRHTRILSLLLTMVSVLSPSLPLADIDSNLKIVVEGNTAFALELYRQLRSTEGNLFLSPYSISTALAMTYAGARENTAKQMADTLRFSLEQQQLHSAFARLESHLNAVQEKGNIQLNVANSLWPQKDYPFLKEYLALIKECYGVLITPVDYKTAHEAASKLINEWVEEKTKNKIRDLIQPGVLDALTRLVLVNAIYFKGNWASQFKEKQTENAPFRLLSRETIQVPTMSQKQKFGYAEDQSLQILELPYIGDDISMLVLLPKQVNGLSEIEKNLTVENLRKWTAHLSEQEVMVFLPKFKMTSEFRLDKALISMGMSEAFDMNKANFAGMDGNPNWLYIAAVIHKAFVDVNEEGTEAAAATAVVTKALSAPPLTFRADHPFIFLIRENLTGSILFIGRVTDPTKEEA